MNKIRIADFYKELSDALEQLEFPQPVIRVYNPLRYAWEGFEKYLGYAEGTKRVVFLGMNPGPWGMTQTGVPFGEVNAVKDFLGIREINITRPEYEHEEYPVNGLDCKKSEVSGKRLWGLFQKRYGTAEKFFAENFVLNYCPLLFLAKDKKGNVKNFTPDKFKKAERKILYNICDSYLSKVVAVLAPEYVVGIGNFAEDRALDALVDIAVTIAKILHPSPASPKSNVNWGEVAARQLIEAGVWKK